MKRSSILFLIVLAFFTFGYRLQTTSQGEISKIYLNGSLLIRSTPMQDIRLYDVANPTSPGLTSTIPLLGNHDVAVKSNYMYADNFQDLIVYDISNPKQALAVDTIHQVFSQYDFSGIFDQGGRTPQIDQTDFTPPSSEFGGAHGCASGCASQSVSSDGSSSDTLWKRSIDGNGTGGKAGSLARFAIVDNYLYCINDLSMTVYDISNPARPQYKNEINVGWDIETVFPYKNFLFMGGAQGMYVYNIGNRTNPVYYSEFSHARSCDPVVADGDYAYVTLRSGSPCGDTQDELGVINIGNVGNPYSVKTVPMSNPYGLTVRNNIVTVCDGTSGLKILNASDPNNIRWVGSISGITPYDVIQQGNLMVVTAESGFLLYDISNPAKPSLYSQLQ
jgi:hypothetical protein